MAKWKLRFPAERISDLARRYEEQGNAKGEYRVIELGSRAREVGQFRRDDFLEICKWKSPRSQPRCERNTTEEVSEITRIALSTGIERLRIEVLQCLHGVGWPTASVLLHLAHQEPYPILDIRALWSWGFDTVPAYRFDFWWDYVRNCRRVAQEQNVTMRALDRALWQYSKDNQGKLYE